MRRNQTITWSDTELFCLWEAVLTQPARLDSVDLDQATAQELAPIVETLRKFGREQIAADYFGALEGGVVDPDELAAEVDGIVFDWMGVAEKLEVYGPPMLDVMSDAYEMYRNA